MRKSRAPGHDSHVRVWYPVSRQYDLLALVGDLGRLGERVVERAVQRDIASSSLLRAIPMYGQGSGEDQHRIASATAMFRGVPGQAGN